MQKQVDLGGRVFRDGSGHESAGTAVFGPDLLLQLRHLLGRRVQRQCPAPLIQRLDPAPDGPVDIAQVAAGQRAELSVFGDDYPTADGTGVRDYIHVMDLAEGHAAALAFLSQTTGWHAINLGTGRPASVLQMLAAYERACGRKLDFVIGPRREGDAARVWADASKARELLGWTASRTLEDMCADSWRWCSTNPRGYESAALAAPAPPVAPAALVAPAAP